MIKKTLFILLLTIQSAKAFETNLMVGTSISKYKLKNASFLNENETITDRNNLLNNIRLGVLFSGDNYSVSLSTNRLLNKSTKRQTLIEGQQLEVDSLVKADVLTVSKRIKQHSLGVLLSNVNLSTEIAGQKDKKNAFAYGLNYSYQIGHYLPSVSLIAPNDQLDLDYLVSFNFNYLF